MDFANIAGVIMDMDGVLWRGEEALPGLIPWFEHLRARGLPFALATNNSGKSPLDYVHKLARLGVNHIGPEQIVTSGTTAVDYLRQHYPPGARMHVLGGDGLRQVLADGGFTLADTDVRAVVIGMDHQLNYEKLKRASLLIRAGADFIGTNDDATYPTPEGLAPGAGSLMAALRVASGRAATVILGKPNAPMFEAALHVLKTPVERTLMIGDRLNTDVAGAQGLGLRTALVLTGVATRAEAAASASPPDGVFEGLPDLMGAWR